MYRKASILFADAGCLIDRVSFNHLLDPMQLENRLPNLVSLINKRLTASTLPFNLSSY